MTLDPPSTLTPEIRRVHAEFSPYFADFVDQAGHPDWNRPEDFRYLGEIQKLVDLLIQPWPTLVSREKHRELEALNSEITKLVKSIPRRVFGDDVDALARFYGLDAEHARLVAAALGNPRWIDDAMARSDLVDSPEGFRCIEVNVASNLGGWHCGLWGNELLAYGPMQQFLESRGLSAKVVDVTHRMIIYLLRRSVARFRTPEIHLAMLRTHELDFIPSLVDTTNRVFDRVVQGLGGKIRGSFRWIFPEELEVRDGKVYHGEQRIHALMDSVAGFLGIDITRCWVQGGVDLYNGPPTPVLNDKRNLALAWELAMAPGSPRLDERERRLLEQTIPWTHRVGGAEVLPGVGAALPRHELIARRRELVLKPCDGSGGKGVLVGMKTDEATWAVALDQAFDEDRDWLVQTFAPSRPMLYFEEAAVPHSVVWSFFDFGGTRGGSFIRMSPEDRSDGVINAGRGASLGPVFEVEAKDSESGAHRPEP